MEEEEYEKQEEAQKENSNTLNYDAENVPAGGEFCILREDRTEFGSLAEEQGSFQTPLKVDDETHQQGEQTEQTKQT